MFINLLIGLLLFLILSPILFTYREGQGPMVGSIMFPTSYKGITDVLHKKIEVKEKTNTDIFTQADTEVQQKKDVRVDTDIKSQHWLDKKKDVDEKKNVDVVHRQPQVLNTASIQYCNKKQDELFKNYTNIQSLQKDVKYLTEWMNKIVPTIIENEKKSKKNANNILKTTDVISTSLQKAEKVLHQSIPNL